MWFLHICCPRRQANRLLLLLLSFLLRQRRRRRQQQHRAERKPFGTPHSGKQRSSDRTRTTTGPARAAKHLARKHGLAETSPRPTTARRCPRSQSFPYVDRPSKSATPGIRGLRTPPDSSVSRLTMAAADQEGPVGGLGAVGHLCQRTRVPWANDRDLSCGARGRGCHLVSLTTLGSVRVSLPLSATCVAGSLKNVDPEC